MHTPEELKPQLVFYAGNSLLEGPVWDEKSEVLYFISITDNVIYRFNTETTEVTTYPTSGPVGAAVLNEEGMLLSAEQEGIFRIDPETKERTFMIQPNKDSRLRYNDGKLDPKGRFFIGTMGLEEVIDEAAHLYVVEDGEAEVVFSGVTISNGLGWSRDGQTFYYIDSPTKKVRKYEYDPETRNISNEQTIVEITDDSIPDGMCVDVDDNIWVAQYGGKKICKWDSNTGEKLVEIPMPVSNVTSCCIGGREKDTLYITTAKETDEELSGGLFQAKIR